jgi:hypothetical protein
MEDRLDGSAKGKQKQQKNGDEESSIPNPERPMASRVYESASGLARDLIGSASADAPSTISSSSTLGSKSQTSSSSSAAPSWTQTLPAQRQRTKNGVSRDQDSESNQESFRSLSVKAPSTGEFEEFQSATSLNGLTDGTGFGRVNNPSEWAHQFQSNGPGHASHNPVELYTGAHIPDLDDGAEVRSLLSGPNFFAGTEAFEVTQMQDPSENDVADLFPQEFSSEEASIATKIKSVLPPAPIHKPMPADHPLNLRPQFQTTSQHIQAEIRDLSASMENTSTYDLSFFNDTAQKEHWLSEWNDVLNSYTDEVWGDMLPAVKAAKTQLEEISSGMGTLDTKAIARLKMILDHVNPQTARPLNQERAAQSKNSTLPGEVDENSGKPIFHCPWVSCHRVSQTCLI